MNRKESMSRLLGAAAIFVAVLAWTWQGSLIGLAQEGTDDPLRDPVVRGAWLYEGNCTRCHGPYEQERLGHNLEAPALRDKISGEARQGCAISWGRRQGGPLSRYEIDALVSYMLAWEEAGLPPDLPPLPPQPTPTVRITATPEPGHSRATPVPSTPEMDDTVRMIVEGNPLALGAWLYTRHCYRCHLSYEQARMGQGKTDALLRHTIENGKTATSMKPFSRHKGGPLKVREIQAIVRYIVAWEEFAEPPALPAALFTPPTPDPADLMPIKPPTIPFIVGDPAHGAKLYAAHCARCHGEGRAGLWGPPLVGPWTSIRPDLTLRSTVARGTPHSFMPGWGSEAGGPLVEAEIADLVAFLVSAARK